MRHLTVRIIQRFTSLWGASRRHLVSQAGILARVIPVPLCNGSCVYSNCRLESQRDWSASGSVGLVFNSRDFGCDFSLFARLPLLTSWKAFLLAFACLRTVDIDGGLFNSLCCIWHHEYFLLMDFSVFACSCGSCFAIWNIAAQG